MFPYVANLPKFIEVVVQPSTMRCQVNIIRNSIQIFQIRDNDVIFKKVQLTCMEMLGWVQALGAEAGKDVALVLGGIAFAHLLHTLWYGRHTALGRALDER